MKTIVFSGPTIAPVEVASILDATCLPPAQQGDVIRALALRPDVIVIIDGAFRYVPALWHKEILYALSRGVHVIGAASMGALRAAELAPFGMRGVGRVFESFHNGTIQDDDEVAVCHAPAELNYRALTLALIDIRFALNEAIEVNAIPRECAAQAIKALKRLPYQDRSLAALDDEQLPVRTSFRRVREWLCDNPRSQKRDDALQALSAVSQAFDFDHPNLRSSFRLRCTPYWRRALAEAGSFSGSHFERVSAAETIDELRLMPRHYLSLERDARFKALGDSKCSTEPGQTTLKHALRRFRGHRQLEHEGDFELWLDRQQIGREDLDRMLSRDLSAIRALAIKQYELDLALLDETRAAGIYGDLVSRALAKRKALTRHSQTEVPEDRVLLRTYQTENGLRDVSQAGLALSLGLANQSALVKLLADEHRYRALNNDPKHSEQQQGVSS